MENVLERLRSYARSGEYKRVPVSTELYADAFTPIEVMRTLRAASRHCYLLESAEDRQRWGRYSFLGYAPTMEITCANGHVTVTEGGEEEEKVKHEFDTDHPGDVLRKILRDYKSPRMEGMPPFTGGLVGYFSYDYMKYAEPSLKQVLEQRDDRGREFRDMDLMLFDKVIVFDHYRQKLLLITGVSLEGNLEENYRNALLELSEMERLIRSGAKADFRPLELEELKPEADRKTFDRMVKRAKEYIYEGDIFQVVLSNPMTAAAKGSLFDTYRVLRTANPSPYMFYFSSDDIEVAGASPETLARLENGRLYTFPLAGTRPRGASEEEDLRLEKELLSDEKELSEHNMLVDLGRNDIGKISEPGTVRVDKYMEIQRFSHVMHIGSTVSGEIRPDKDSVDVIDAILPAGTLSGAPKIRACEIIAELENRKRGIYGGAVGYLDFTGNIDTCISIRLAYKKNGRVCVQSGAGIVADSVPENEFKECQNKAGAVIKALRAAKGGLA
nr:anthranilate synthase component I [uncultured Mediterraneibacter sp.]